MSDKDPVDLPIKLALTNLKVLKDLRSSDTEGEPSPSAFVSSISGDATLENDVIKHHSQAQAIELPVAFIEEPLEEIRKTRKWADEKYAQTTETATWVDVFSDIHAYSSRTILNFSLPEYSDTGLIWGGGWRLTICLPPESLREMEAAVLEGLTACSVGFYCSGLEYEKPRTFSRGEIPVLMMTADYLPGYLTALSLTVPDEAETLGSSPLTQTPTIYQNKFELMMMLVIGLTVWSVIIWGFSKLFG